VTLGQIATNASGLSLLNDVIGGKAITEVDTVPEINALANIVDRLLTVAADGAASPALTAADLAAIGITGVTAENLAAVLAAIAATDNSDSGDEWYCRLRSCRDSAIYLW
jgi:hypothetical protein